ncbi:hypothetical protein ACLB2K_069848 [Fragaria x ananassa]
MMTATPTALIQRVCSVPLARAVRTRALATAVNLSTTPTPRASPADSSRVLLGLSEAELQQLALDFSQQGYRGKQLHQLIYKRKIKDIQDFSQVPLAFRNELEEAGWKVGRSPIYNTVTAADGTVKLLIKLEDNRLIETVGIPVQDEKGRMPAALLFCATGKGGFSRNLKRHEIVEQVLAIEEIFKHRVTNVVFMGMGEPMMNLKSVLEAHQCLNKDVQIGQRMMTISTVGVPNTIKRLASHKLQSTLAVSLHAPNQKLRETIVPSAKAYPLSALMKDCSDYFNETSRRVSFEYALLAGVNDGVEHARELAELLHQWGKGYHVNLIPFNPIEGSEYKRPSKRAVQAFAAALESGKITVSTRQTRGLDADAACGQLRNKFQKSPLVSESDNLQPETEADVAVASFQTQSVNMRRYSPEYYSPPRRSYGGGGGGGRGRSPPRKRGREQNNGSLLVRNIPLDCRPEELRTPFERFGLVRDVYIPKDYYTGEPRGFAFVQFVDSYEAAEAQYHMNGKIFAGREISVVLAAETRKRPEEMRQRTRVRGPSSGYGDRRSSHYGRSRSRSRSPHYPSGSRSRYRSRSYSPVPRRRVDSVSPVRRRGDHPRSPRDHPRSSRDSPLERGGDHERRPYSPGYDNGAGQAENGDGYDKKSRYDEEVEPRGNWRSPDKVSRSPSGSRSRSAELSPRRSR